MGAARLAQGCPMTPVRIRGKADAEDAIAAMTVRVEIRGEPVPKGRPRFGRGRVYTPADTKDYEARVGWELRAAGVTKPDAEHEWSVQLLIYEGKDQRRGDIDNYTKALLDAANKIVWADDKQVSSIAVSIERGAAIPRVVFTAVSCRLPAASWIASSNAPPS